MNSISKRKSPFDIPLHEEEEEKAAVNYQEPKHVEPMTQNVPQERQYRSYATVQKPIYQQQPQIATVNRDKYTATMDKNLRRRIKIACATNGIMFSEFIEAACREKLAREGLE